MNKLFDLSNKVAIVTGGAGGLGKVIARGLASQGADLVICGRTLSKLEQVAKEIEKFGHKVLPVVCDVTDENSVKKMVEQTIKQFNHIDILVNAAGINVRGAAETFNMSDWKKVMDFNVAGTFMCCQAVGNEMIKQKSGKIVNVSSVKGRFGAPMGGGAYCPSKAAVDGITRTLAAEWAKYNIQVNAIAPAVIHTELTQAVIDNPTLSQQVLARIPMNKFGEPEDLIGPTVLFVSAASNYVTGQILYIDGGQHAT